MNNKAASLITQETPGLRDYLHEDASQIFYYTVSLSLLSFWVGAYIDPL